MSGNLLSRILHLPASMPSETSPLSADVYAIRGDAAWWIFDVGACDEAVDFINNLPCVGVVPETAVTGNASRLHQDSAPLKKNIVISHFHRDHFFNLSRVHFDNLFVGRETFRHCDENIRALGSRDASCGNPLSSRRSVTVAESPLLFEDGIRIRIEPIPSSHAKGSLMLSVGVNVPARVSCDVTDRGALDGCDDELSRKNYDIAFLGDATYPTVGHSGPDSYNVQLLYRQIQFLRSCRVQNFYMSHRRFVPREKESVMQVLEGYYARRESNKSLILLPR